MIRKTGLMAAIRCRVDGPARAAGWLGACLSFSLSGADATFADPTVDADSQLTDVVVTALHIKNEATKLNVEIRDLPQDITTLDAATFQVDAVTSLEDFGHMSASLQPIQPYSGAISGGWNSRGYNAPFVMDGLSVGNIGGGSSGSFLPDLLSSAEILSGPAAIIFGQGSPGGLVNLVTNKPLSEDGWTAKAVVSSENQKYLVADFTGNLAPGIDGRILIDGERSDSFRPFVQNNRNYIAPQIHWQITDQLSWRLLYIYDDYSYTFDPGFFYSPQLFGRHLGTSTYFGDPYTGVGEGPQSIYRSDLQFDFNDHWSAYILTQYLKVKGVNEADNDRIYPTGEIDGTVVGRGEDYNVIPSLNFNEDLNLEAYVRGKFDTFGLTHQMTFDVAYQRGRQSYYDDFGTIPSLDYAHPVYSNIPYTPVFQYHEEGSSSVGSHSVAFSDLVSIGEHIKIMGGIRHDNIFDRNYDGAGFTLLDPSPADQLNQGHVSKQGSFEYRPVDAITLYFTYSDAFQPNVGLNANNVAFQPVKSINREIGIKTELFDKRLSLTGAVYRIHQDNTLVEDPGNPNFEINGGSGRSMGFESEANWAISRDAHVRLGVAHTKTEYLYSDYIPYGDKFPGIPLWTVLLAGDYKVTEGLLSGLRTFVNANYNDAVQSYVPNADGAPIPKYVRLDLGASYPIKNMLVQFNVKNSLNQRIILSNGRNNEIPEAPRTYWLTFSWRGGSLNKQ